MEPLIYRVACPISNDTLYTLYTIYDDIFNCGFCVKVTETI